MRKAKIICTLGPASDSAEVIEQLIDAGMNIARFNFSHGTQEEHRRRFNLVRRAAKKLGKAVAILQDVQGPKIRLGKFEGGQSQVSEGTDVVVTTRNVLGGDGVIPTPVKSLPRDVRRGDPILLDDGRVRLRVTRVKGTDVHCEVEVGGLLKDKKGLNLPGAAMSIESVTDKDASDIAFGQQLGVDYVALSFVRSARDVERARKLIGARKTPIIAKIEKPQALQNIDEIARASDGIMVARGDLGVEMPLAQLPGIQKHLVRSVNGMGKLVIVATEMLESMVNSPRPTRAEVSDVANAILDGADAVMLSGETASGKYPVEAARTMAQIVVEAEKSPDAPRNLSPFERSRDIATGVAAAAVAAAEQMKIGTIVAYTESGYTAKLISEFRPNARILALTPNEEVVRRTALYWGVECRQVKRLRSTDAMLAQVRALCRTDPRCDVRTPVIIVTGVPLNEAGNTNLMTIHQL